MRRSFGIENFDQDSLPTLKVPDSIKKFDSVKQLIIQRYRDKSSQKGSNKARSIREFRNTQSSFSQ